MILIRLSRGSSAFLARFILLLLIGCLQAQLVLPAGEDMGKACAFSVTMVQDFFAPDVALAAGSAPTVTVEIPAGNEFWAGGSSQEITWIATDVDEDLGPNSIVIDYYNSTSWISIASGEEDDGTYLWTIPNLDESTVRIRVTATDLAGNSGFGTSDSDFTIDSTFPEVILTSPNGGEYCDGGSSHTITWEEASDTNLADSPLALEYYDGSAWIEITSGLANSGSYNWNVSSDINTSAARVRITAIDKAGNAGYDQSNGNFTIDSEEPMVTVTSPDGDNYWAGGSWQTISWTVTDASLGVAPITIEYSINSGVSWISIATGEDNDGSLLWVVPNNDLSTARIRVSAVDLVGNTGSDDSVDFTIDSTSPEVTLTSPNGGECWAGGSTHAITWEVATDTNLCDNPISIQYYNGSSWVTIATNQANDNGSCDWVVSPIDTAIARVRVTAADLAGNTGSDISSGTFTIDSAAPLITVIRPNGGEYWAGGSSQAITWSASDDNLGASPITLEFSHDGGSTWETIATDEPNDGTYTWAVDSLDISSALIRITATDDLGHAGTDTSNSTFTIDSTDPVAEVISPNGNEYWAGASTKTVTWTATDTNFNATPIKIEYYDDSDWVMIEAAEPNDGTYSWNVPSDDFSTALVRITVTDLAGHTSTDVSNTTFTIDSTNPEVVVTSPDGEEYWAGGNLKEITWTASDANFGSAAITLEYWNGTSWVTIALNESNDGSYNWTVNNLNIDNVWVRITAADLAGNSGKDQSNSTFTIDSAAPVVEVISPTGNEYWAGGSTKTVTWTATDTNFGTTPIKIEYYDGSDWVTIEASEPNDGSLSWIVDTTDISTAKIKITATDLAGNSTTDESDSTFTIDSTDPEVTVNSPNGGEDWKGGSSHEITWTGDDTNPGSGPITIEYYNGSTWVEIADDETDDGTYTWPVPSLNIINARVRITFTDLAGNTRVDESNADFTLDSAPVVTVAIPNSGEYWKGGSSHEITWTAIDINLTDNPITIEYYDGSSWVMIAAGEDNDGTYTWVVEELDTSEALIRVSAIDTAGHSATDESDSFFTIDSTVPELTVTIPEGGEYWKGGNYQDITWAASDQNLSSAPITIEFFNGTSWGILVTDEANSGNYTWMVPNLNIATAQIRVSAEDLVGHVRTAVSGVFTIDSTDPQVNVISPNGGEWLTGASLEIITWTVVETNPALNPVTIEYYDGTSWQTVITGISDSGSYSWNVPNVDVSTAKVRVAVVDMVGNTNSDESNGNFTIDSSAPEVIVISPNGGECWGGSSSHTITWSASDDHFAENPITLELSIDGGSTWETIAANESNDGIYDWIVNDLDLSTAKIKVTATDELGQTGAGESNSTFTIDSTNPVIEVIGPNGGEYWAGEYTQAITWAATDANFGDSPIKIEYWDGSSWTEIAVSQPNNGTYSWGIPSDINISTAKIRITATDKVGHISTDESNSSFTLDSIDPLVKVNSPNAEEDWKGGSSHEITWTVDDTNLGTAPIAIEYYNGSGWVKIADGEPDDGTYTWTVPYLNTLEAKVKITATDLAGNIGGDTSDACFTIDSAPVVTVAGPNGGEQWAGGGSYDITWTATDINFDADPITIQYYDGLSWTTIVSGEPNDGTYTWMVVSLNTANALIKVSAIDTAGNIGEDESSSVFTIDSTAPQVTVTSPKGGEYWAGGSLQTIAWAAPGGDLTSTPIAIEYYNGSTWITIVTDEANDGSYTWTVPNPDSSNAKIRVSAIDQAGNTGSDESDSNFTIDSTFPEVSLSIPNGGEHWIGGSLEEITWTATDANFGAAPVTLQYYDGSAWVNLATAEANDGTYVWALPFLNIFDAKIRISATDLAGNTSNNESDAVFTIDSAPEVTVTSPNGGEYWAGGSQREITWTAADANLVAAPITIEYYNGSTWLVIATSESNDGSYLWTVPDLDISNTKIKISANDQGSNRGSDESDLPFAIDSTPPPDPNMITNSDEPINMDTSIVLEWSDVLDSSGVTYRLEVDDNADFSSPLVCEISLSDPLYTFTSIPDDGLYYWRVQAIDGAGNESTWTESQCLDIDRGYSPPLGLIVGLITAVILLAGLLFVVISRRGKNSGDDELTGEDIVPDPKLDMDRGSSVLDQVPSGIMLLQRLQAAKKGDRTIDRQLDEMISHIEHTVDSESRGGKTPVVLPTEEDSIFIHTRAAIEHMLARITKFEWEIMSLESIISRREAQDEDVTVDKNKLVAMQTALPALEDGVTDLVTLSRTLVTETVKEAESYRALHWTVRHELGLAEQRLGRADNLRQDNPCAAVAVFGEAWTHAVSALDEGELYAVLLG